MEKINGFGCKKCGFAIVAKDEDLCPDCIAEKLTMEAGREWQNMNEDISMN